MVALLRVSRVARESRRHVRGLSDSEIDAQLRDAGLNARGDSLERRERLFRWLVLVRDPQQPVPWFADYDTDANATPASQPLCCAQLWGKAAKESRAPRQTAACDSADEDTFSEGFDALALNILSPPIVPTPVSASVVTCGALITTATATTTVTTTACTITAATSTSPAVKGPITSQVARSQSQISSPRSEYSAQGTDVPVALGYISPPCRELPDAPPMSSNGTSGRPMREDGAATHRAPREEKSSRRASSPASKRRERKKRRVDERTRSVPSSSTSESETESRASAHDTVDRVQCARAMRDWALKFSADGRDDPAEFLADLEDFKLSSGFAGTMILQSLPCVLYKNARFWFRAVRASLTSWRRFVRAFRDAYCDEIDDQDLLNELRQRTQGKGERVAKFIDCFRAIVNYMRTPPSERKQARMARGQLRPEYRRFMDDKTVTSLADIVKHGKEYERLKRAEERFEEPPPKSKVFIPSAAFAGPQPCTKKLVAVEAAAKMPKQSRKFAKSPLPEPVSEAESTSPRSKKSRRGRRGRRSQKKDSSASSGGSTSSCSSTSDSESEGDRSSASSCESWRSGGSSIKEVASLQVAPDCHRSGVAQLRQPPTYASVVRSPPVKNPSCRGLPNGFAAWSNAEAFPQHNWARASSPGQLEDDSRTRSLTARCQSQGSAASPFFGICYVCQRGGHRASTCPVRTCYTCGVAGHLATKCKWRAPVVACQVCETPGVTFLNCQNCIAVRQSFFNARAAQWASSMRSANRP